MGIEQHELCTGHREGGRDQGRRILQHTRARGGHKSLGWQVLGHMHTEYRHTALTTRCHHHNIYYSLETTHAPYNVPLYKIQESPYNRPTPCTALACTLSLQNEVDAEVADAHNQPLLATTRRLFAFRGQDSAYNKKPHTKLQTDFRFVCNSRPRL